MIYEKQPASIVLANPNYRTPEAGLRFYANGNLTGNPVNTGPAKFIIDRADEQSVGVTAPPLEGSRPVEGPFFNLRNRDSQNSVHVEVQLIKLINDGGILADGQSCDVFNGACDPVCYINVDFERPNEAYPGGADRFVKVVNLDNINSPALDVVFPGSNCASTYKEANVRVYCEDSDTTAQSDLINKWSCPIKQPPSVSKGFSQWSSPAECHPVHQAGKIRLTYKYKVYFGSDSQCNNVHVHSGGRNGQSALVAAADPRNQRLTPSTGSGNVQRPENNGRLPSLIAVVDPTTNKPLQRTVLSVQQPNRPSLTAVIDPRQADPGSPIGGRTASYDSATVTPVGRRIWTARRIAPVVQPQTFQSEMNRL
ncbi:hypothetical protein BV898_07370 [Hypsibius exemplaris]|uniref:Uncharacterized protein n=1 Tax=Hypsibius exemplaris TaxID=2072580 RepID=A0A1W0WTM5_HYPEX|nr:hypothetical protein BV898_07370 [Hypsibius exemplaris]